MIDICNLYLTTSPSVTSFSYYTRESKDVQTGRYLTNLYICELCVCAIQNDIFILSSDEESDSVPFKLLPHKHLCYYEYNRFKSRF